MIQRIKSWWFARNWPAALVTAIFSFILLAHASEQTGYVRDEGVYFEASLRYAAWIQHVVDDPNKAFSQKTRDRAFSFNREHPPLMKLAAAWTLPHFEGPIPSITKDPTPSLSADVFQQMRRPAQLVAAFGVFILFIIAARRHGHCIALFGSLGFILLPRVFYHAQLHCFDVPIAVLSLIVCAAFVAFIREPSWKRATLLGFTWGLALATKHNAFFFPVALLTAYAFAFHKNQNNGQIAPLRKVLLFGSIATAIGGCVYVFLWPWLWHDTIARFLEYIEFHREHSYYNMEFGGINYNQPPFPWSYSAIMTAITVPLTWILLSIIGGISAIRQRADSADDLLWRHIELCFAIWPLLLIALPGVPIFGGTKHWLVAYPFWCLLAARGLAWLFTKPKNSRANRYDETKSIWHFISSYPGAIRFVTVGILLLPAGLDTSRAKSLQLAQYSSWFGGPRAAAQWGANRAFWGGICFPAALQWPTETTANSRVFSHDLHPWTFNVYRTEKRAPSLSLARPSRANFAYHFHEKHFMRDHVETINAMGTLKPISNCMIDGVTLVSGYKKNTP